MEEQFVPYELAVKLKEMGFDEQCIAGYRDYNGIKLMTKVKDTTMPLVTSMGYGKYCHQNKHVVKAPLWQQAFDWFMDNHNLFCFQDHRVNSKNIKDKTYWFGVKKFKEAPFGSECVCGLIELGCFKSFPKARQACLEKLIELIS